MEENTKTMAELSAREIEEAIVCALLTQPAALPDVVNQLTPEMFRQSAVAFIYTAIQNQYERGGQPDFITTEAEMLRMDAARCEETGGLAVLGASLYRIRHAGNLAAYVAEVKRRYLTRRLHILFTTLAEECMQEGADPTELVEKADRKLLEICESTQKSPLQALSDVAAETLRTHRKRQEQQWTQYSVCTGFSKLDFITGGLQPGEVSVFAGRPGDGKTAIALQIAANVAAAGGPTAFFSLEMHSLQLANRLFTGQAGIDSYSLRMSRLTDGDYERMEQQVIQWKEHPFYLNYTPGITVEEIRAQILTMKKQHGCKLAVIDYLHLMGGSRLRNETGNEAINNRIQALKRLALEAECVILVLSQMNRQIENRADKNHQPQLSDLRDSGGIEQAADTVIFVSRPDRHGITQDPETGQSLEGIIRLIVRKNRHGHTGTVDLEHNNSFTTFTN